MPLGRGAEKPTGVWAWAILGNNWPEDASIASLEAMVNDYRRAHAVTVERVSVLESARDAIARSMVGEAFEAMHERMTKLVRDRNSIADGIEEFVNCGVKMVELCYETQKELAAACKKYIDDAQERSDAGDEPGANAALVDGMNACRDIAKDAAGDAKAWGEKLSAAMPVITPATWGTPPAPPGPPNRQSGGPSIQQAGLFGGIKQAGGPGDGGPGRADPNSNSENAQSNNGNPSNSNDPGQGKPDPNANQGSGDGSGQRHGHHGSAEPAAKNGTATPPGSSSLPSAGMGGVASAGGAGGTGLGSPGTGLGGLSGVGMGGMNPAGMQGGASSGGLGAARPPMLSAPSGAGSGSAGGGSAAGPGVSGISSAPPSVPVTPVSAAPPVSATPSAATPSASAGAFGANTAAVQPMSAAPSSGGGTVSAGSGPVAMAPLGGSAAGAPPPAQVGPAPTASPGLSQGSIGPAASSAAAAGNVSSAASGMSVAPASFTEDGPSKMNPHAQMAVNTVKALIPGVASYPGLAVAAAVVKVPGGIPQVVIATNEGEGYLPEGCFLPPGVIHAFVEMGSVEFDLKWLGWVDPARTLIDYVVTYEQRGEPLDLLGLASSVAVSDEVKAMFPQVVPKVTPDAGAKPLGPERGRNRHRLQVLAPAFYDQLQRLSESRKERVAVLATRHAMKQPVAAFLCAPDGPWHLLSLGTDPTDEQWAAFREDFDGRARIVGTMRPGFLSGGRNDELNSRYQEAYQQVRAMETLLGWRNTANASLEDIIYSAHQTGIDISPLLLESADRL